MRARPGLTLVELLIAVSLLCVVMGTVVATMSGGLRVWERAQRQGSEDQQQLLALETLRHDLHNLRAFRPIPFRGEYDSCSFPMLLTLGTIGDQPWKGLGRTGYFLDERRRTLCRSRVPYEMVRARSLRESGSALLEDVNRVRFEYFGTETGGVPSWHSSWSAPFPPMALKVELTTRTPGQRTDHHRQLIIELPLAQTYVPPQAP